jgi:hypothetical protein
MFTTLGVVGFFVGMIALSRVHSAIKQLSELRAEIESLRNTLIR